MALSVITLNVNGLRDADKCSGVQQWLRSLPSPVDVVCLQETHCLSEAECSSWFSSSGFSYLVSPGSVRSCGCIVLFRPSLSLVRSWSDDAGRYVQGEFSFHGVTFRVLCIYAPNRNPARDLFFNQLDVLVDPATPTVLCGDFNTVFDRGLDRVGSSPDDVSRESTASLARLFSSCCVVDIWRCLHPTTRAFSWSRWDGSISSRIDLFGCPYPWIASVSACEILPCPFSDHCAVSLNVDVPHAVRRGPGRWKLNISLLEDEEYVSLISRFLVDWRRCQNRFSSPSKWWEECKVRIKSLSINYGVTKSKKTRSLRDLLVRLADHLKSKLDGGNSSCLGPYNSTLAELAKLDLQAAQGAQVRSRVKWVEEGESSSAFFLRLERKRGVDRQISALKASDGSIVADITGVSDVVTSFYTSLFSSEVTDDVSRASLLQNVVSSLSSEEAEACDGLLSPEECSTALRGMARRKAPGSDGLPMEFYLKFWDLLGEDLVCVLNSCFRSGRLSLSQRRGVISLSFKKGDRLDIRNWRPISLLNVDYKLAARAIAGRLLKVIHIIVGRDQTCGVPGRFIGENVAFLRDVVDYAASSNSPVALLSLDQEKAFDRVEWSFMRATLLKMGFGPSFVGWVDLFYCGVQSAVDVNGHLTPFFSLSRGVRQGCPLSPLLYVLVAEVLACNIRANPRIVGVTLPGSTTPLPVVSQYADDTSLVVTTDDSIKASFESYSLFEKGSGAKLNLSKSKGLWLGSWVGRADSPVALDWSPSKLKILGVFLGLGNLEEANWRPRIDAVHNVLLSWRQRILSFHGRSLVINALALARVWYVASLIHMPAWVLKELNSLVFTFFWKGRRELVARSSVVQHSLLGGFSIVNVKFKVFSLVAQWVKRFASSPSSWSLFMTHWFRSVLDLSPLEVFSQPLQVDTRGLPPFYQSLVLAWGALDGSYSTVHSSLVMGSGIVCSTVASMSAKSCYAFLLSESYSPPHCVLKFSHAYGDLYWPSTWRQLFLFSLDRPVIDLSWKISHGVLYTAARLFSFGLNYGVSCFCRLAPETSDHLFFSCPLAQSVLAWLQSLMFLSSSHCPSLCCRHVLFGFNADELRVVPNVFVYALNVCKYFIWHARNDFRFRDARPGAVVVMEGVKSRLRFHLPLFFKRFKSPRRRRYFGRQWGAHGVIGSVVGNRFVVHL